MIRKPERVKKTETPEVTAWHPAVAEVEQQDEGDRQCPHPVEGGLIGKWTVSSRTRLFGGDPPEFQLVTPATPQVKERFATLRPRSQGPGQEKSSRGRAGTEERGCRRALARAREPCGSPRPA